MVVPSNGALVTGFLFLLYSGVILYVVFCVVMRLLRRP